MINRSATMIHTMAFALCLGIITQPELANAKKTRTNSEAGDYIVKFKEGTEAEHNLFFADFADGAGKNAEVEQLGPQFFRVGLTGKNAGEAHEMLNTDPRVDYVQPNFKISIPENYSIKDSLTAAAIAKAWGRLGFKFGKGKDNPEIPEIAASAQGPDPLRGQQWGMQDIGVTEAWQKTMGKPEIIVAVIDTGVDYTHQDLLPNIWRNKKEIPKNGIDDDKNGYVDDVIGWDFAANDNKPYDLAGNLLQIVLMGSNPGHGTHCAGNIAAKANNGIGIAGVAPNVKIMPLRFITEKGQGTTANAIKAIRYAVDNGAKILSNSWGSEGEDPSEGLENKALKEAILYAQAKGVLFIAAAGNGHSGKGYDNDTDPKPGVPASYKIDNIISVAAIDSHDQLGSFSNWGKQTVHLAAPGVNIFSTTVGNNYNNYVINFGGIQATWDGTSMATPHVAGAAALYWSAHPEKSWQEVKAAIMASTKQIPVLKDKTISGGKLDVRALLK